MHSNRSSEMWVASLGVKYEKHMFLNITKKKKKKKLLLIIWILVKNILNYGYYHTNTHILLSEFRYSGLRLIFVN